MLGVCYKTSFLSKKILDSYNEIFCLIVCWIDNFNIELTMKILIQGILIFFFLSTVSFAVDGKTKRRIIKPKECRTSKYTCILKKTDGVPFFCVRTSKQRYQNARKKMRIVSRRSCLRRYPVVYEDVVEKKPIESE